MQRRLYGASLRARIQHHAEVRQDGCWVWTAALQSNGYGRITVAGRKLLAHRAHHGERVKAQRPGYLARTIERARSGGERQAAATRLIQLRQRHPQRPKEAA